MNSSARSTRSSRRAASQMASHEEERATDTIPEELFKEEDAMQEEETENADNDQEMKEEGDGNELSSLGSINDDDEMEDATSPSPDKAKDMHLRSGRRKRRRSRETTGLTPPEDVSARKRVRVRGAKKKVTTTTETTTTETTPQETIVEDETKQPEEDEIKPPQETIRTSRDSILLSDHTALAAANQEPETLDTATTTDDNGRRLFDAKPPIMPTSTKPSESSPSPTNKENETAVNGTAAPSSVAPAMEEEEKTNTEAAPSEGVPPPSKFNVNKMLWFYVVLIVVSFQVWIPLAGKLALAMVPLTEEALQVEAPPEAAVEVETEVNDTTPPPVPPEILNGLAELTKAKNLVGTSADHLHSKQAELVTTLTQINKHADVSKRKMIIRLNRLVEAEKALQTALEQESKQAWKDAKTAIAALRLHNQKLLVDTSLIDLWQVEDPVECPEEEDAQVESHDTKAMEEEKKDPPISPRTFETTETNLLLRATMTAERIVRSKQAEANVRAWVRDKIDAAIEDDDEILAALEHIQQMSSDDLEANNILSLDMIQGLLKERLEMEMADGTGAFDHAALMSGAKIIYGGKRGTSKSTIDSLPLYNRLMMFARLRFYGYGPEAAITPTYPKNTLGQCWSFQPLPMKEQLKTSHMEDDHKHGSFATLTVSFAKPVNIETISIEHPTVTDHPKSAIRGFRIIGYQDALATGTGHPMGSFQYRMGGPSIQEFPVADKGAMQSLSLAIDSNWGLEYACLYRFRVHGESVEDYK